MKAYLITLGCPKNEVDSQYLISALRQSGIQLAEAPQQADILIVNTCAFIREAKEESVDMILDLARIKKRNKKKLVVTGCLAQRYSQQLLKEIPEIDLLVGIDRLGNVGRLINEPSSSVGASCSVERPGRFYVEPGVLPDIPPLPYAYLKISEGCDNGCSFCAIPSFRGRHRSRTFESILAEARYLVEQGVKELNLVAQDTTTYGRDRYGTFGLAELLWQIGSISGDFWIRILYAFPRSLTPELIEAIAQNPKVCKYLDLPLQHCNDELLAAMNRKITKTEIRTLIDTLRQEIPGITLRTSYIVGFPGETEKKFVELLHWVKESGFDYVGGFTYSREENTRAASLPQQVVERTKQQRLSRLIEVQREIAWEKNQTQVGKDIRVLVEGKSEQGEKLLLSARGQHQAPEIDGRVFLPVNAGDQGQFFTVNIIEAQGYDLFALPKKHPNYLLDQSALRNR